MKRTFLLFLIAVGVLRAQQSPDKSRPTELPKGAAGLSWQVLTINNLWSWHRSDGEGNHSPGGEDGVSYPIFTARCLYEDNLVFGGIMYVGNWPENGGSKAAAQPIRVNGGTYLANHGMAQGWVNGMGAAANYTSSTNDPAARIYRIRRDYFEMSPDELVKDASIVNEQLSANDATQSMVDEVREQYFQDWETWPTQYGAPFIDRNGNGVYDQPLQFGYGFYVDSLITGNYDEPGIAAGANGVVADQVLYTVYHGLDRTKTLVFEGSEPIGLEVQKTVWGYKSGTELSDQYFLRYRFINKGGVDTASGKKGTFFIDSLFFGQWVDVDIGNAGDDLIGCDTLLHLGYGYNANQVDVSYSRFSLPPPSSGYTILEGPLVQGSASDTGTFGFQNIPGKKNLGLTSFAYLKAGALYSDPPYYDYQIGTGRWWKMLRGFAPTGTLSDPPEYYNRPPSTPATPFPLSGDPVNQTGFVDGLGTTYSLAPGDARFLSSTGPSRLAPGDTAEMILAFAVGLGADRISSISIMKANIQNAREAFHNSFEFARAPERPSLTASGLNREIILDWGANSAKVERTENTVISSSYRFEGYNIYQLPSHGASLSEGVKIATFDVPNGVGEILSYVVDGPTGFSGFILVQRGTDSGIRRSISIKRDYLINSYGDPIYNGREYYYAVTAYNYTPDGTKKIRSLESDPIYVNVVPKIPFGIQIDHRTGDTISVSRVSGNTDGQISARIFDPLTTSGHAFEIRFEAAPERRMIVTDMTTGSDRYSALLPPLGRTLIANIDGVEITVHDQAANFRQFLVTANALGPLIPPEIGAFPFNQSGFPFYYNGVNPNGDRPDGTRQQSFGLGSSQGWGIHAGGAGSDPSYTTFKSIISRNDSTWDEILGNDFEIRFTPGGGQALSESSGTLIPVPFELWNAGEDSASTSDDYRMIPVVTDVASNGVFDYDGADHFISALDDDPETDWISWYAPVDRTPGQSGYNAWVSSGGTSGRGNPVMSNMVLVLWNGGSVSDLSFPANVSRQLPETGTIFRIAAGRPFTTNDRFVFASPSNATGSAVSKSSARRVGVYPNPYFAGWNYQGQPQQLYVTFNNLPPRAKIRIFNLAGQFVRTLDKNDNSQFLRWDLTNEHNWQVGSGIYICLVEMPDIGETKTLKLALVLTEAPPTY